MLATSTRLLAALLNHRSSAEWFQAFGDAEAPQLKLEETLGSGGNGLGSSIGNWGKLVFCLVHVQYRYRYRYIDIDI